MILPEHRQWRAPLLALPPIQKAIKSAQEFGNQSPVEFRQNNDGVVLKIPNAQKGEVDRLVVLKREQVKRSGPIVCFYDHANNRGTKALSWPRSGV